jgi:phosphatidylglycerophosphate synthase
VAGWLASHHCRPNAISLLSIAMAAFAGISLLMSGRVVAFPKALLLIVAVLFIQARLLCNLFDGMVAVEGGFISKSGEIYNDAPDRLADLLIMVSAGYAEPLFKFAPALGWAAGCSALLTAYVRALGVAAGASPQFCGPMAKQHRMFLVSIGCLSASLLTFFHRDFPALSMILCLIIAGAILTIVRRLSRIVRQLENQ